MTGSTIPRLFVDFQNADAKRRILLTAKGTLEDLERTGLQLQPGLRLILYCLELETEGIVRYSEADAVWYAEVDWENLRPRKP